MESSESAIVIRDAAPADLPTIETLTLEAYQVYAEMMLPSAWDKLSWAVKSGLATTLPVVRLVAEQHRTLIGSVMLFPAEVDAYGVSGNSLGIPELRLLAVTESARGQGIGQKLVEACLERARQSGAKAIGLHTSHSMTSAMRLYERLGFVRHPADDFQPEGAELVMAYRYPLA